ncbi:uncharacterized protein BcabD6B2_37380 [Babesia caballi]|uniref:Uncharacterized protein n=1 Tax=Babesia caballi TaxID=5871 RepID=A0AAV4LVV8_BABCB|nr:hypothetical protein, conserved [Babesia caballi]
MRLPFCKARFICFPLPTPCNAFSESQRFVQSEDAIMDISVFAHIRKVISYLYREEVSKAADDDSAASARERHSEYLAELNTNVLNTLVNGYVGYAWLCEVCARWIEELNVHNSQYLTMRGLGEKREGGGVTGTVNIVREALMGFLTQNYDSEKMRVYMEDKADHDKWNPPELYWNLMKSSLVVSHMIKIYHERPKDEFLSSWYQDYINNASANMKLEQADLDREGLSRITSNFSVFTLRISEEIRRFLLKDDILDSIEVDNTSPLSPLFWHAENAYIYSQALLHFIYQWRIDLRGCRRLSQLIARTTMYPAEGLFPDATKVDGKMCEWSASQIHLLMTNFARFPNLHSAFKRLCVNQRPSGFKLNEMDVCDFYEELNKTLNAFDNYGILLFDRSRDCNVRVRAQVNPDSDEIDESVSQYGDMNRSDEYMRLRNAPEMPPLEAIRESNLLNQLVDDFANEDLSLPDSNTWIRYANLLVLLSVSSPYEMLYFHYDELVCDHLKRLPQREVWKRFYLPEYDDDSSLDEIEQLRDFGTELPDDEIGSSMLYSLRPQSSSEGPDESDDYSDSGVVPDTPPNALPDDAASRVHKAWNTQSDAASSEASSAPGASSVLSSSAFESELCHNVEVRSASGAGSGYGSGYVGGKVHLPSSYSPSGVVDEGVAKRPLEGLSDMAGFARVKRACASADRDASPDRSDDEFLEIKSTLASAIYKNTNEDSRLGAPKNISAERLAEMKEMYASFKIQSDKVKAVARKELYHLYKLIHTPSMNPRERDLEMRGAISTVIASSIVMSYIRHTVVKKRSISALCNVKLLLLKEIADKHTVKRAHIAVFLRDVCVACAEGHLSASSSAVKLNRLECIADLLVYLARFERQCVPIVAIFHSIVDRSISRHFISTLLRFCGAPYGEPFVLQVLKLLETYLSLGWFMRVPRHGFAGSTGSSALAGTNDTNVVNYYVRPFLDECAQSWSDNTAVMEVAGRCEALLQTESVM